MPDVIQPTSTSSISYDDGNTPLGQRERLRRSPQPYHRNSSTLPGRLHWISRSHTLDVDSGYIRDENKALEYFDADDRTRRKLFASPSDSGTEADDEGASLLKGLPAPPIRPRKGPRYLRSLGIEKTPSPLLTPSALDDDRYRLALERQLCTRGGSRNQTASDEEVQKLRDKFTRRRRAEVIRRISETLCLGVVAFVVINGAEIDSMEGRALRSLSLLVFSIYVSYPLRILLYRKRGMFSTRFSIARLRIPAAFDPAPLLYPIVLPVLVALSLMQAKCHPLLPNLVLSASSMPTQVIPFYEINPGSLQWVLSIVPIVVSTEFQRPTERLSTSPALNHEALVLLFPLHQALLPSLGFLTTTSLLPAELQLLSVAMINLYLFSTSPQAVILQALLWIGGIAIFILCRGVLKWVVAIARVPSWRFRRVSQPSRKHGSILYAMDDYFGGTLSSWWRIDNLRNFSESEEDHELRLRSARVKAPDGLKLETRNSHPRSLVADGLIPVSAVDQDTRHDTFVADNMPYPTESQRSLRRRHTLPTYFEHLSEKPSQMTMRLRQRLQSQFVRPKSFLSLTSAQATILKWTYALYVYVVVIATIAVPIRYYVSRWALHGNEPLGWALGYLLGDLPTFRFWTVSLNLERWIRLPSRGMYSYVSQGRVEQMRQVVLGAANVRLLICAYCIATIIVGLTVVFRLSAVVEVDTRRKVFHGMMVVMFLPVTFIDPAFASLALALILAIFLLLDLFRASQLPPLSRPLTYFLAPYVDGRDHRGPVIVSHIFLLIGCAIPLWLSLAAVERDGVGPWDGWEVPSRDLSMISGVVCVGMGDAAASLIGRRYGLRRWLWSGGKSLEGSLAFAIAVVLGLGITRVWLQVGGWAGDSGDPWMTTWYKATIAATGASFTEAVLTGGNDNVVVPVILWLLVRGLKM